MSNDDRELDIIRGQVTALIDQARDKGLKEDDRQAINAEVDRLWARLSQAKPMRRRWRRSTSQQH